MKMLKAVVRTQRRTRVALEASTQARVTQMAEMQLQLLQLRLWKRTSPQMTVSGTSSGRMLLVLCTGYSRTRY
jgi:hypothetical protein